MDVMDGASMAKDCPTALTPPSPPILSFNQNMVVDINVVKAKTFFSCFMSMILGQFMQMENLEVEDDQTTANGGIKQMVHQVHAKSCRVSTIFMSLCCSYDSQRL
jgi:hypothetical protein